MPFQSAVASTTHGHFGRTMPERLPLQSGPRIANTFAEVRNAQPPETSVTHGLHASTDPGTAEGPPQKRARQSDRPPERASIAAAKVWRALSDDDKARTTMGEFAVLHNCSARSLGRFVTYEGDFKLPMLRHLERESPGAPQKRLVEALADYRRQHSGFIDPQAFLMFATEAGVRNFSGFPQMIKGPDFVSIKPTAAGDWRA